MKMKDQVASVEPAKELKELGVKQDGHFSYFQYDKWNVLLRKTSEISDLNPPWAFNKDNLICSAYTVAELGEMLPTDYITGKLTVDEENAQKWACIYLSIPEFEPWWDRVEFADTEADVRAKMLIRLIKEGRRGLLRKRRLRCEVV